MEGQPLIRRAPETESTAANEIRISSWSELQNELFADLRDPALGRFRFRLAFRGLSDASCRSKSTP